MAVSDPPSAAVRAREYDSIASYFDRFASEEDRWLKWSGGYTATMRSIATSFVPEGQRVLEVGCGRGDLLAALRPSVGVGVDVSEGMIDAARRRHPELRFMRVAGEELDLGETFDYVVLWDLVPYVYDLQALLVAVVRHCHPRTRVLISTYSNAWRPLLSFAARLGLRPRRPVRNWVAPRDLANLVELAGLEVVVERKEILLPFTVPFLSPVLNGMLAHVPGFRSLDLSHWLVARPAPVAANAVGVSVIVPCRNEAGSIADIVERVPEMGRETELVFVENGSTDDTRARIEEQVATADRDITLVVREAAGKWSAVQAGFAAARHEVLMILDADLTVAPEDLPKFYEALVTGRGELINGSRLVYGMETGAMRFLNLFGNKFFAWIMSTVLGQYVKDTLCGTKVLFREDWERMYKLRSELGPDDPFGDYHLLLGAALLGLKVLNVPVRYGARTYGTSNMQRFSYGGTLTRLALAGYRRLWVEPVTPDSAGDGKIG
jgi:SAM-dependent methyltransferase